MLHQLVPAMLWAFGPNLVNWVLTLSQRLPVRADHRFSPRGAHCGICGWCGITVTVNALLKLDRVTPPAATVDYLIENYAPYGKSRCTKKFKPWDYAR